MNRDQALSILRECKPAFERKYSVRRLGLFGSVARDEARDDSDIDVVIDLPPHDLWTMVGLRLELEEHLGASVDLVRYRGDLPPRLKRRIDGEAVYV
ncbi:MAG: nucleotidyltransferase domain-containing protein [Candidatus Sumerlaeia bacterium]|nr:nucleotidyltransferase domain-containing protein [Candidatus Sumerlaeia bacterium]